jgi:signal transduction histidine kinase
MMNTAFYENTIFAGLPPGDLAKWDIPVIEHRLNPSAVVLEQGEPDRGLFLIGSGSVALSRKLPCGHGQALEIVGEGGAFGDTAFLDGLPQPAKAEVVKVPAVIWEIPPGGLDPMLEAWSEFRMRFFSCMTQQLLRWNRRLSDEIESTGQLCALGRNLAEIVHDLKTPMASILQTAYYLRHCPAQELIRLGEAAEASAEKMVRLTQDILDFSNGTTRLDLTPVYVETLLDRLDDEIMRHPTSASAWIEVTRSVDSNCILSADADKILRVFANLGINAIEAMPDGGSLNIAVTHTEEDVIFEFRDTGNGIQPEILERIFEPFMTSGKSHGTGLGMAIAKRFIDAHHGRIWIDSKLGAGTSVFVLLPRRLSLPADGTGGQCSGGDERERFPKVETKRKGPLQAARTG